MSSRMERRHRRDHLFLRHKLAVTIHSRNLTTYDTVVDIKLDTASYTTTHKVLAAAQRDIEIVRELGITHEEVFSLVLGLGGVVL